MTEISSHTFERLKFSVHEAIGQHAAESLELSQREDVYLERLVHRLTTRVLATTLVADQQTHEVHHPASWWQHMKHSHAPGWFTRRYPVRYTASTLTADYARYRTYPCADVPAPAEMFGFPVTYETATSTIESPWRTSQLHEPQPENPFLGKQEIAYEIARDRETAASWQDALRPDQILKVLDALGRLGVNPNELVARKGDQ